MTAEEQRNKRIPPHLRFFFIHVMKTGGTTFWFQLAANFHPDEMFPNRELDADMQRAYTSVDYMRGLSDTRKDRIRCYAAHLPFFAADDLGGDVVTMTILRDPVDRVISHLKQLRSSNPEIADIDLESVYDRDARGREQQLEDLQVRFFALTADDRPANFLTPVDIDKERLTRAKENLERVDLVGLHECFDDFLDELRKSYGFRFPSVPDQRVSEPGEVSESFRRRIAEKNAADVEFYDHAKGLVGHHRSATRTDT